jgi:hypothetical protein
MEKALAGIARLPPRTPVKIVDGAGMIGRGKRQPGGSQMVRDALEEERNPAEEARKERERKIEALRNMYLALRSSIYEGMSHRGLLSTVGDFQYQMKLIESELAAAKHQLPSDWNQWLKLLELYDGLWNFVKQYRSR